MSCIAIRVAACAGLALGVAAQAQDAFPNRPVRFIVPFTPGTGSDAVARIMANAMAAGFGQAVIVDNRGGAGGITGTEQGAKSPPDGYTLTVGTTSTLIANPALNSNVKYSAEKDFVPVAGFGRTYFAIVTANSAEAPKTLQELIDRVRAHGGSYGSSGVGTITHLASEALMLRAKVSATHVPYKGGGASLADVVAGHTLFVSDTLAATLPLIRSGRLRALAVTSSERLAALHDVPTVAEAANLPGFMIDSWWGLMAPAGTPDAVVKRIGDVAIATLGSADTRARFAALEIEPLPLASRPFADFIRKQTPLWVDFIRQANVKLE